MCSLVDGKGIGKIRVDAQRCKALPPIFHWKASAS